MPFRPIDTSSPQTSTQPAGAAGGFRPISGGSNNQATTTPTQPEQNKITTNLNSGDYQTIGATLGAVANHASNIIEQLGGKNSFFGKIGNYLAKGSEDTAKKVIGEGVSLRNAASDAKDLFTAPRDKNGKIKLSQKDRSAKVPLIGRVQPYMTGQEKPLEMAGKVAEGGLIGASLIEGGRELPGNVKAAKELATEGVGAVKRGVRAVTDKFGGELSKGAPGLEKVASKTAEVVGEAGSKVKSKIGGVLKGKTESEIMKTAPEDVKKLSKREQEVFFQGKEQQRLKALETGKNVAKEKATQMTDAVKKMAPSKEEFLINKTKELEKEAAKKSIAETQGLKPKLLSTMKKSSDKYAELVEKEIAPVKKNIIDHAEISADIEKKFADDPNKIKELKETLGITGKGKTTIGDIYNKTKALRQEISKSAIKGSRVFTPEEMKVNNAVSYFSDFLKSKGVDLKEANSFWRNYAPMRDKLVQSIQPFTTKGAETGQFKTFAKGIQKAVAGNDPYNEEFIKATEDMLGTKIGNKETRDAMAQLTKSQKELISTKVAEAERLANIDMEKEQAVKTAKEGAAKTKEYLSSAKYAAERDSNFRNAVKKYLKIGASTAFAAAVGKKAWDSITSLF